MLTRRLARPESETALRLSATAAECARFAAALDLPAVAEVEAALTLRPWGRDGLAIEGRVTARVQRLCVVTGESFEESLDEPLSRRYRPGLATGEAAEVEVGAFDADEPEPLPPGGVDLAELAHETLALGLDPHPRAPGADLSQLDYAPEADSAPAGPFAALATLKPPSPPC